MLTRLTGLPAAGDGGTADELAHAAFDVVGVKPYGLEHAVVLLDAEPTVAQLDDSQPLAMAPFGSDNDASDLSRLMVHSGAPEIPRTNNVRYQYVPCQMEDTAIRATGVEMENYYDRE
jgi:hypothetical protein